MVLSDGVLTDNGDPGSLETSPYYYRLKSQMTTDSTRSPHSPVTHTSKNKKKLGKEYFY